MSRTTKIRPIFKKIKNIIPLRHAINYLIYAYVRLLFLTYRLEIDYNHTYKKPLHKIEGIFYFWHQNIVASLFLFYKTNSIGHGLISTSKDGKILGFIAKKLGFKIIYASAYKKSLKSIRQTLEVLEVNKRIATTGDGSRGPAFKLQRWVIYLSSKSKLPLIFIDSKANNSLTFYKSWDNFKIPLPFSKIRVRVNAPVFSSANSYKNFKKCLY